MVPQKALEMIGPYPGNSTSELGFNPTRTVNASFFPAGKRQKIKGPKKLLPTSTAN